MNKPIVYAVGTILCRRGSSDRQIRISDVRKLPDGSREYWYVPWIGYHWGGRAYPVSDEILNNLWVIVAAGGEI